LSSEKCKTSDSIHNIYNWSEIFYRENYCSHRIAFATPCQACKAYEAYGAYEAVVKNIDKIIPELDTSLPSSKFKITHIKLLLP
jgi:hypothetical protein